MKPPNSPTTGTPVISESRLAACSHLWLPRPVSQTPEIVLCDWQVFDVLLPGEGARTRHLAGSTGRDGHGRVSSAVRVFDARTRTAVTESGRVYKLHRSQGFSLNAEYVWRHWVAFNAATDVVDVSAAILELLHEKQ